ncbi:MAG: hypothetical protein ACYTKD_13435 [Planctomycetota bacterium]|jgi:hypothetical protein
MRQVAGSLLASVLVTAFLCPTAEPAEGEDTVAQEIAPGRQAEVRPLDLERPAVFRLSTGDVRLDIRATPDGMVRLADVAVDVEVAALGAEGNRVTFRLVRGASVSIWPVERMLVTGGTKEFSLDVTAAGWAFVVRADNVGRRGLSATCDGAPCRLYDGQRIDADRKGSRVVFRAMRERYPGSIVERRIVSRPTERVERRTPRIVLPSEGDIVDDALPGILPTVGRDLAWQGIPLPVMAWEVFRPPDVSP